MHETRVCLHYYVKILFGTRVQTTPSLLDLLRAQRTYILCDSFEIERSKLHERSGHVQKGHDRDVVHENFKPATSVVSLYFHFNSRRGEKRS